MGSDLPFTAKVVCRQAFAACPGFWPSADYRAAYGAADCQPSSVSQSHTVRIDDPVAIRTEEAATRLPRPYMFAKI